MSLRKFIPVLVAVLLVSVAAMYMGAAANDRAFTLWAAVFFPAAAVVSSLLINVVALVNPLAREPHEVLGLFRRNTRLAALVYVWGAAALFSIYSFSGVTWRHGWQYGLGMTLIAVALIAYVQRLGKSEEMQPAPVWMTLLHAAAAAGGLVYLIGTGKLETLKGDWAANNVFLMGGLAILTISLIAALAQWRLTKNS
jgi:hypothetical protein